MQSEIKKIEKTTKKSSYFPIITFMFFLYDISQLFMILQHLGQVNSC